MKTLQTRVSPEPNKSSVYPKGCSPVDYEKLTTLQIISALCSLLPGSLQAIDENSEELFYRFVHLSDIDRSAFSYNWPYVIQAARKQGFYYQNGQGIVYFYLRMNAHDSRNCTLIVVNHLGYESETVVCELAEAAKKLAIPSIIKNIDRNKVSLWNKLGFQETIEPWSKY